MMAAQQGILCLTLVTLIYGLAFFYFLKERKHLTLWLIVLGGFGLRLFTALDPMLHKWDERYHALVAKNMMTTPFVPKLYNEPVLPYNYKDWSANEIWVHKQPVPLWSMAISMMVFGVNELALRLPALLLSTLCLLLTFYIGQALYSTKIGLIAAFLQSINGLVIELASGRVATDHIDTFFLFFVELAVYLLIVHTIKTRKWLLILARVSCGLAILTKWLPALIILLLYAILHFHTTKGIKEISKELVYLVVPILLVSLPWQLYAYYNFPLEYLWEQEFNKLHFTTGLDGHGQPWYFFLNRIRINVNEVIYLALGWFVYDTVKNKSFRRHHLLLWIWLGVPFIFFSIAKTKMQGYLLFTFPAYFLLLGLFLAKVTQQIQTAKKQLFSTIGKLIVLLTIGLAIRYSIERVKPFQSQHKNQALKTALTTANFSSKTVVFNMPHPIEAMFYTDGIAYPNLPTTANIQKLTQEGYHIAVIDDGNLPRTLLENEEVEKVSMLGVFK